MYKYSYNVVTKNVNVGLTRFTKRRVVISVVIRLARIRIFKTNAKLNFLVWSGWPGWLG